MNKDYVLLDPWHIIQDGFNSKDNRIYESQMSIGNGFMGIRGNFEETFSGNSLQGTYVAGVYYPDKTRVGWWKNGYPEYFAKVLNSINFIGIKVFLGNQELDLDKVTIKDFKRDLNMKEGTLTRTSTIIDSIGRETKIESLRFLSKKRKEIACIRYSITPLNYLDTITLIPYLDGNIVNEDSNYDETFWDEVNKGFIEDSAYLTLKTKKLDFHVTAATSIKLLKNETEISTTPSSLIEDKYVAYKINIDVSQGETLTLEKYVSLSSNRYYPKDDLVNNVVGSLKSAKNDGFDLLLDEHVSEWNKSWESNDIFIDGDVKAQQSIRFNIFQLHQTYTGEDSRLNIGPKGFTGEKYGGSTYWDTEAYCLPFYLGTSEAQISKNLLIYRYNQLEKAKENAAKLGLKGALYPMVTMNGEECHNEWEITFEEIHRNGAIAYAIYNYVNYTGDHKHLLDYGIDVLVEISRFWEGRVIYNKNKNCYMILGVTGPNEYENNVNNNWYTNRIASWTLEYTLQTLEFIKNSYSESYEDVLNRLSIKDSETVIWMDIIKKMYYPKDDSLGIFLQQDGYLDKEDLLVKDIPKEDLPLNQTWSWDRILRSPFIKQADVLQGLYFLGHLYDLETKRKNFYFYEPRTLHESSLSPCVHSILASELGDKEKAYSMYLRTARLDLDNLNNDTDDGLHITSMAGTWMSIVQGFGGMRITDGIPSFKPFIPDQWIKYSFRVLFRERVLSIEVSKGKTLVTLEKGNPLKVLLYDSEIELTKQH
ncbi:family 65 glycosyl hydrolase domain-containing protein [Clostridium sp. 'White wine YQ']|uniref:family 65 glycosyl hydrolase domain-containing protein n=1 Tax=Clostridium sp. 'White wine YQ' TaxID=3027474 RepID=UPI0023655FC5|nr:family 65 glycosyl hydrolase domain-containing protein [Clostridium sp. 'White wine YQ']MDD7795280.1 family 65 glycosyl hydrolase domain-containing protein [Clostridium sp. 'White wine YQ']